MQFMKKIHDRRFGILFLVAAVICIMYEYNVWNKKEAVNVSQTTQTIKKTSEPLNEGNTHKTAYLTFDDGPSCLSEKYLDILKKEGVTATFFIIGQQVEGDAEKTVKRALKEGNEIGIHTYCHEADCIYTSVEAYYEDVMKTKEMIEDKFKYKPVLVRFPWGSANNYIASYRDEIIGRFKKEGIEYQDWNVSAEDSVGTPTVESILYNVRKDYKKYKEPVILMHDSGCNTKTLAALEEIITELKNDGYDFANLSKRSRPCHFYELK